MEIQYSFIGMESSNALREYTDEKLKKHEEYLIPATSISVDFKDRIGHKGVNKDFEINIKVTLPKAVVGVKEVGDDMYALVDKASDVLSRRLKRYFDKKSSFEGEKQWENVEEGDDNSVDIDNYINYTPKVFKREKITDTSPMFEAEAIERMELLGSNQLLFKNAQTGNISMIYKDIYGRYILKELDNNI